MTPLTCEQVAGLLASGALPWREGGYPCVERWQADLVNADRATAQTILKMAEQIRESTATTIVERSASRAVSEWRGGPLYAGRPFDSSDDRMIACSVWFAVKSGVKFVEHADQIKALLNEEDQLQLLIRPDVLLRMRQPAGDCAVFTPLICALLGALGLSWEIVTVACDPREPDVFSHVYPRAVLSTGQPISLDASHGRYPGWEVPRQHQIRKQVWDMDGRPVEDLAPTPSHLGAYRARRVWPRRIGLSGLGQVCVSYDIEGNCQAYDTTQAAIQLPVTPPSLPSPTVTAPTGVTASSFDWNQWLGNAINQGIKLAGNVVAPQTTVVRGPGGQLLIQGPASSVSAITSPTFGTAISGTGGGNVLLLGGAALVLVLLLGSMKGGR